MAAACYYYLSSEQSSLSAWFSSLPFFVDTADCTTGVTTRKWRNTNNIHSTAHHGAIPARPRSISHMPLRCTSSMFFSDYYRGTPSSSEMTDLRLISGSSHPALASEIAGYLGLPLTSTTIRRFSDGEIGLQINDNVRETHVFVIAPVSKPVNDTLVELLLLVATLRRSSAAEITAVIPYFGYSRQDRKMTSRVPISAADVALMLDEMGVDRVISVDLHTGQIQGFFPPRIAVENLEAVNIGALYFSEKELKRPVIIAPSSGSVPRAKKFREVLSDKWQGSGSGGTSGSEGRAGYVDRATVPRHR